MKYRLLLFALIAGCAGQEIYMIASEWSRWSPWSFCSAGVRVRVRACATVRGFKCMGHNKEFQSCDLATTTSSPSKGKSIDDPFLEDRDQAMRQLYPDYDQPFKPKPVKVPTTEAPFFKNNQLLERLRENDSLAALINRAATVTAPSTPSPRSSPPPPPLLGSPSQEEYEDEEIDDETTVPSTTTTSPPSTTVTLATRAPLPEIRVATVTAKPEGGRVTAQLLARKRGSTTIAPAKEKMALESLEHYVDEEEEEGAGSEYEEPSEGDQGGIKSKGRLTEKTEEGSNGAKAAASKIVSERERIRSAEEQREVERRRGNQQREHARHKVDGGDEDTSSPSSPKMERPDLPSLSSQINHIPVAMPSPDPFEEEEANLHSSLLGVESEMRDAEKKSRRDLEFILKRVNGIIEKLEYEARFRGTQGEGLSPLQHAYLKRSRDIRNQLVVLMEKASKKLMTTTSAPPTTTSAAAATPPEPLNPKIAEDTVRALDWLMENIHGRLAPDGGVPTIPPTPPTTTARPRKVLRNRSRRPSYMKGVQFIENGEEIHPHPVRLRSHSSPSQRSFRLPSSSIRTFSSVDGGDENGERASAPTTPVAAPPVPVTPLPIFPTTLLPAQAGIEPILGTDWQPFEWSEWSEWSECVCNWQLRKRICVPNSEEVQCPAPEYQRRKCEGGSCSQPHRSSSRS